MRSLVTSVPTTKRPSGGGRERCLYFSHHLLLSSHILPWRRPVFLLIFLCLWRLFFHTSSMRVPLAHTAWNASY